MIQNPMDVLTAYPVRKSKKQKQAFREDVLQYAQSLGYEGKVEKGSFGSQNVIFGDSKTAKYLITAHYDTCARLPFPNLITPCNFWTFMGYQLVMTLFMLLPLFVVTLGVMLLTDDADLAFWIGYLTLWVDILFMFLGPANRHNANDNTSGVVTVLQTMAALPAEDREKVAFILFDLEEAGLWGSASYQGNHKKETKNQIVLNLDCVGDGDEILLFPTGKLKKDEEKLAILRTLCGVTGDKSIALREKGFQVYPSDQRNFPYGVGIAAFHRNRFGTLYCSRIHTSKDTILEEENVAILSEKLVKLLQTTKEKTMEE